jgi:hypothetical protein
MTLLSRVIYAFYGAVVFSAVAALPALLFLAFIQPKAHVEPGAWFFIVPAILFTICFIYAEPLRARMPISRW